MNYKAAKNGAKGGTRDSSGREGVAITHLALSLRPWL
jgi:hypothetical protein